MNLLSELRIGNYLFRDGVVVTIDARSIFDLWDDCLPEKYGYKAIPITEKWLLSLGFVEEFSTNKKNRWLSKGCVSYNCQLNRIELTCGGSPRLILPKNIIYIHQLQNLYFALTDEELLVK